MEGSSLAESAAPAEAPELDVDLDAIAADLDGVDTALRRLDEDTYGSCEVCAATLSDERLADDPVARRCPEHAGAPAPVPVEAVPADAPDEPPPF